MIALMKLTLWQPQRHAPGPKPRYIPDRCIYVNPRFIVSLHRASREIYPWPEGSQQGDASPEPTQSFYTEVTLAVRGEEDALEYSVEEGISEILAIIKGVQVL